MFRTLLGNFVKFVSFKVARKVLLVYPHAQSKFIQILSPPASARHHKRAAVTHLKSFHHKVWFSDDRVLGVSWLEPGRSILNTAPEEFLSSVHHLLIVTWAFISSSFHLKRKGNCNILVKMSRYPSFAILSITFGYDIISKYVFELD